MAKVTNTKTGKSQGDKPATNSKQSDILVEKNGKQRTFSRLIWDNLPEAKEGWKEVKEAPAEPAKKADPKKSDENKAKDPAKEKKAKDPKEDPKKESGQTIEKTLTQEDLDGNPELVEQGFKVGDVVEIEDTEDNG